MRANRFFSSFDWAILASSAHRVILAVFVKILYHRIHPFSSDKVLGMVSKLLQFAVVATNQIRNYYLI